MVSGVSAMRESTIEQIGDKFLVRLFKNVLIKVIEVSSIKEATFISHCWDSGIFTEDEFLGP